MNGLIVVSMTDVARWARQGHGVPVTYRPAAGTDNGVEPTITPRVAWILLRRLTNEGDRAFLESALAALGYPAREYEFAHAQDWAAACKFANVADFDDAGAVRRQ